MDISAIVLAGGQGARMGYQDKAWVNYQGKPLIMHVIDAIAPQVQQIVISCNNESPAYQQLGYPRIADSERLGPLSGVYACTGAISTEVALIVPCDIPDLPADLVSSMLPGLSDATDVVLAEDSERVQHLVFIARKAVLTSVRTYLADGGRSVIGWLESQSRVTQNFDRPFSNINEVGQLQ